MEVCGEISSGKTLLGNWVEERQVVELDTNTGRKELQIRGHSNILTNNKQGGNYTTTCDTTYKKPVMQVTKRIGKRHELIEQELYKHISNNLQEQFKPKESPVEYISTTKRDFSKDFEETAIQPSMDHDVNNEQPLTFWKQHVENIDRVTTVKHQTNPFKKNAAFSTPIEETFDVQKPGEEWQY